MREENKQPMRLTARRATQDTHSAPLSLKLMTSYIILPVFIKCL